MGLNSFTCNIDFYPVNKGEDRTATIIIEKVARSTGDTEILRKERTHLVFYIEFKQKHTFTPYKLLRTVSVLSSLSQQQWVEGFPVFLDDKTAVTRLYRVLYHLFDKSVAVPSEDKNHKIFTCSKTAVPDDSKYKTFIRVPERITLLNVPFHEFIF